MRGEGRLVHGHRFVEFEVAADGLPVEVEIIEVQAEQDITRLDLDDYNNEGDQGLHITSMPGSWLAVVRGFAGLQIQGGTLKIEPVIPEKWSGYSFKVNYLGNTLHIQVGKEIKISLTAGKQLNIQVYQNVYELKQGLDLTVNRKDLS